MPSDLVKRLQQVDLFADLSQDDLKAIAKLVKREYYAAGHVVSSQGEIGQTVYFIESGELRVQHVDPLGIERVVGQLGPGDCFGQTSLLLGEPRDATVEVIQDATLLYLDKAEFDQLLAKQPSIFKDLRMRDDVARKYRARQRRFRWQDEGEVVVVTQHRHNAILLRNLLLPCFGLLVVLCLCVYWWQAGAMLGLVASAFLGLLLLVFTLYLVADHRDDIYIVTTKRVVRRQHTPLGRESRVDAPLRNIQDIQELQVGLWAQWFNYGDLIIETAGERAHVAFREVPNPEAVREAIFEQKERVEAGTKVEERAAIREDMRRYFDVQVVEEEVPAPEPAPEKTPFRPALFAWVRAPFRIFSYFLPRLRYEQGDTITWRKHWVALLKPIAPPTALVVVFTLVAAYLHSTTSLDPVLVLVGYSAALVFLLPWWLWRFDDWQNDIYQVTSTRIIDVERLPFYLREERREASLGMLQNISLEIPSTLGRLLNYGSVTIETAGAGAFTFDHVKDPSEVQAEIFRRMEAFQKRQSHMAAVRRRRELLDWFAVYDQMRSSASPAPPSPSSHQQET